jgi:hypothetical protein
MRGSSGCSLNRISSEDYTNFIFALGFGGMALSILLTENAEDSPARGNWVLLSHSRPLFNKRLVPNGSGSQLRGLFQERLEAPFPLSLLREGGDNPCDHGREQAECDTA